LGSIGEKVKKMKKWAAAIAVVISVILGSCGGSQGTVFISDIEKMIRFGTSL